MPSEIVHCVLCGRRERGARSKYTLITTIERQEKIYQGYIQRHGQPLNYCLINKKVHAACCSSITAGLKPLSVVNRTGRPKLNRRRRGNDFTTNHTSSYHCASSITVEPKDVDGFRLQSSNVESILNSSIIDNFSLPLHESDDMLNNQLIQEKDDMILNECSYLHYRRIDQFNECTAESTSNISKCTMIKGYLPPSPLHDLRNLPSEVMDEKNFVEKARKARYSSDSAVVTCASDENNDDLEIISSTTPSKQANDDQSIEVEKYCVELYDSISSSDSSNENVLFDRQLISTKKTVKRSIQKSCKRMRINKLLRTQSRINVNTSNSRRPTNLKSNIQEVPPCPQVENISCVFSTSFDELCAWLLDLLHNGFVVSMMDVSDEYKTITERRQEKIKNTMFRTSSIQNRLKNKYGSILSFQKLNNHDGLYVGLSNSSIYLQSSLSNRSIWKRAENSSIIKDPHIGEKLIEVIELLRSSIKERAYIFRSTQYDIESLINFNSDLLWASLPVLIKNFVGLLIQNDQSFSKLKIITLSIEKSSFVALSKCVRDCWMEPEFTNQLPPGHLLVIGGPDSSAFRLNKDKKPEPDYILESNHGELYTRILLYVNGVSIDEYQNKVIISTNNIDVILIAIALGSSINLQHLAIKSKYTRAQENIFINVKPIITSLRQSTINPICLLVLHALSGSDTTSFIKTITKEKIFNCFFKNPSHYSGITSLCCIPPPQKSIIACEQLLINSYSFASAADSLDELRGLIADVRIKDRNRTSVASSLPPSTSAFKLHCFRAARQIKIWLDSLDSNPTPPPLLQSGYVAATIVGKFQIKWTDLPDKPVDYRLDSCGDCKLNCNRCKCRRNQISCTFYCKCNVDSCSNQPNSQQTSLGSYNNLSIFDNTGEDSSDENMTSDKENNDPWRTSDSECNNNTQTDDSDIDIKDYELTSRSLNLNSSSLNASIDSSQNDANSSIFHDHNYTLEIIQKVRSCQQCRLVVIVQRPCCIFSLAVPSITIQQILFALPREKEHHQ